MYPWVGSIDAWGMLCGALLRAGCKPHTLKGDYTPSGSVTGKNLNWPRYGMGFSRGWMWVIGQHHGPMCQSCGGSGVGERFAELHDAKKGA